MVQQSRTTGKNIGRNVIKIREGVERSDRGEEERLFDRKWDQKYKTEGAGPVKVQQKIN